MYWQSQQGNKAALFLPGAHGTGTEAEERARQRQHPVGSTSGVLGLGHLR